MAVQLSLRDRAQLVMRAVTGRPMPTDTSTAGGRLLAGVIQTGGTPPARETKALLDSYSAQPWLRAVVSRISYDCAEADLLLFVKRQGGAGKGGPAVKDAQVAAIQKAPYTHRKALIKAAAAAGELEPVLMHPALDLLNNFNAFHVGLSGRRVTHQHLDLVGEAFWLLERAQAGPMKGLPIAIWPVPPSWILGTPTLQRPFYRVSFRGWQGLIPATEFVWFSDLDPSNPYARGSGTAAALSDDLETDEYAAKHAKALFYNRAKPDIIVSPKDADGGAMDETEVRRLEQGWLQRAQGFWKGFKPFFLRRSVDVKELDSDLRSNQFVQLRQFERDTCIQTFGVSPEILGIVSSGANRATISIAEYIYGRRVCVPRLETFRMVVQEKLLPLYDERLILDYVSPVAKDAEIELDAMKARPEAFMVDEWRARAGEEALPDGKGRVFLISPTLDRVPEAAFDLPLQPEPALPEGGLPPEPEDLPLAAGWRA